MGGIWESLLPMWGARMRFVSASFGGRVFVMGGNNGDEALTGCEVFDPALNSWVPLPAMAHPRVDPALVAVDGRFYVLGGHDGEQALYSAEIFDVASGVWCSFPPLAVARDKAMAVALQ